GRFILGLGSQVKGHNERRYSTPWTAPGPRLREMIQLIRHVWDVWQNGARPGFQGKYYQFSLRTPFVSPALLAWPHIPIYAAGEGTYDEVPALLKAKYGGVLDRLGFYSALRRGDDARWTQLIAACRGT